MKKLNLALASLLAASAIAWAGDVVWFLNYGAYTHDATDLVTEESGAILDNYDVLWQLIYAGPNNKIDPIDISNVNGGFVATGDAGDDEVVGSRKLSLNDSGIFDHYLFTGDTGAAADTMPTKLTAGNYVYQRIFESQTPVEGTYYFESELMQLTSGDFVEFGSQTMAIGSDSEGIQPTLQVQGAGNVPEPATMSLLGLGALAMVLRRKLRK